LPDNVEIEDVVPQLQYFEAIVRMHDLKAGEASVERFEEWRRSSVIPHLERRQFSKQVELWLLETFDVGLNKPRTLLDAVQHSNLDDIRHVDVLRQLHAAIKVLLHSVHG
jgi:hypothetical protein